MYLIDRLEPDGFIHPDGSLKLEFAIKKHNYRSRMKALQDAATEEKCFFYSDPMMPPPYEDDLSEIERQ